MERDVERIQELYRAFEKRNVLMVAQLMSPEVEIRQSAELPWGGEYKGHGGLQTFAKKLLEHVDSRVIIEQYIDAGECVVAMGRTVGKTRSNQVEFDVPVVHIWTLKEGRVVRFEPYIDNATMLAALRD
jgi:ketosteroid isomerase-like protein